ncbi:hypothetical protein D4765_09255 [Subtercola vilae]|uniref:General stress protein 17M-like domain-containing protein n=2 Tax=Microbacteriaceae TaxID=85023 RepID=A0A4T2BZW4_9MICO|nr:hypothetical protein D4765_09255 [Subtercola vilae]
MPFGGPRPRATPRIPRGEIVSTYETYEEAQAAVEALSQADFPVSQLTIIGSDLKTVESITGTITYGKAAVSGAISGAWLGIFFGLLLVIFSPTATSFEFVGAALLIGAGFGMLFRIVSHAVTRRRRDFTSTMQVIATSYSIIADGDVANRARNIVAPGSSWAQPAASAAPQPGTETAPTPPPFSPPAEHPSDPPRAV